MQVMELNRQDATEAWRRGRSASAPAVDQWQNRISHPIAAEAARPTLNPRSESRSFFLTILVNTRHL
ncbi:Hypothetical protein NTJ_00556 [Nesidiocoris tenuis]|uniref:Uncharacterized protein n=1 Tax=Nesidiocoris tenuis TaxID=355587 RepID=A0ABN7AA70_9HEMI|nr:Hypothetical protein NTJ_00556 [Nesidiocoris tenuis]